jgi:hypothetical protein
MHYADGVNLNGWGSIRRFGMLAVLALPGLLPAADARGQSDDERRYHLFRPTPMDQMREMSTDRPDQTESPYTVDAGHFQLEIDVAGAEFDRDTSGGDVRSTGWGTSYNVKAGLLHNVDIQFVFVPYVMRRVEDRVANTVSEASGFGDFQTRLKINLWGNDGGKTAFGIMPFIKWPLSKSDVRNGKTEGGVIVPLAVELPAGWSMGVMSEFDFVSDGAGGYDAEYFNTITCSHDIVGKLGGYVEFAALATPENGEDWQGQVGLGFTYGFSADTQMDFGCNFGVTASAPDYNPFIGFSWRL